MGEPITILVGTMTGTAEFVAGDVSKVLEEAGHPVEILMMDTLDAAVFERPGVFLVCTSTYGQGDVPDNARAFFEAVQTARPDLTGRRYGVIGLGDSTYGDTFNAGGRQFDELLAGLGARAVGARLEHNASGGTMAEDAGIEWARGWVSELERAEAA
jgi:MioC protein